MIPGNRHDALQTLAATEVSGDVHGANSCRNKSGLEDKGDKDTFVLYVTTATSFLREKRSFLHVCNGYRLIARLGQASSPLEINTK